MPVADATWYVRVRSAGIGSALPDQSRNREVIIGRVKRSPRIRGLPKDLPDRVNRQAGERAAAGFVYFYDQKRL